MLESLRDSKGIATFLRDRLYKEDWRIDSKRRFWVCRFSGGSTRCEEKEGSEGLCVVLPRQQSYVVDYK